MKIIVAEHFGICFGVRDAIALAENLARTEPLTVLGELVHNPIVRERLAARGVSEARAGNPARPGVRVLITAHGVSDVARSSWRDRGLAVADATCPLVRHAHTQLKQLVRAGYFPVVIGLAGHVEVRGLTEDFDGAFVLNDTAELSKLPVQSRYGVISQTTQPIEHVRKLVAEIKRARPDAEVHFVDTVCKPTKDRQTALKKLIAAADSIVVVGGRASNNTRQLVEMCRRVGRRVVHVERPEDLDAKSFRESEIVGVTAGTSTLPETVAAVVTRLKQFSSNANNPT